MGLIDQLALRAAGAAGSFQQGRLKGEAVRYDRDQAEQERRAEIERRALERALVERRDAQVEQFRRDQLTQQAADRQAAREAQQAALQEQITARAAEAQRQREFVAAQNDMNRGLRRDLAKDRDGGQVGWTFIQTDDGLKRGNSRTGQIEDVPGVTKTPASVQKELASLRALEADLTAAEQAAKTNSGAFSSSRLAIKGLKDVAPRAGSLFRTLSENMADPANSQARIIVAGVSNEALHKKYGSALSVNEIARSELDTPNVDGDNADQILRKIAGMRANVQRRREALQGHATAPTPSAGTPSPAPETKRSALSDLNYLRGKP